MEFLPALFRIQENKIQPVCFREHRGLPPEIYIRTMGIFVFGNNRIAILGNEMVLPNKFVFYQKIVIEIRLELPVYIYWNFNQIDKLISFTPALIRVYLINKYLVVYESFLSGLCISRIGNK